MIRSKMRTPVFHNRNFRRPVAPRFLLSFFARGPRGTAERREKTASATSTRKTRTRRAADGRGRREIGLRVGAQLGRRAARPVQRRPPRGIDPTARPPDEKRKKKKYRGIIVSSRYRGPILDPACTPRRPHHHTSPRPMSLGSHVRLYVLCSARGQPPTGTASPLEAWRGARREILGSHVQMLEHGGSCLEKTELP